MLTCAVAHSDTMASQKVYIADCEVHSGDDCVPIGKYSSNVLVERVRCSCGNGASPIIWATPKDPDAYVCHIDDSHR